MSKKKETVEQEEAVCKADVSSVKQAKSVCEVDVSSEQEAKDLSEERVFPLERQLAYIKTLMEGI